MPHPAQAGSSLLGLYHKAALACLHDDTPVSQPTPKPAPLSLRHKLHSQAAHVGRVGYASEVVPLNQQLDGWPDFGNTVL